MLYQDRIKIIFPFLVLSSIVCLALLFPFKLCAQITKAEFRGEVQDTQGNSLAGAEVSISLAAGGVHKSVVTNEEGIFRFYGLKVGGPYIVSITRDSHEETRATIDNLQAGSNPPTIFYLQEKAVEKIVVQGARMVAEGSARTFDANDIRNGPNNGRDLKNIAQRESGVYLEDSHLYIAGNNNRFNSITIDGMRQDDDFGLNNNGYPTQHSPISLEAIEEITVNQSPFDVRYGNFLGGNINIVTKSGTNEYSGAVFYRRGSHLWEGKKTKDTAVGSDFQENTYGFNLGGPIVLDKAHFFMSLEGLDELTPSSVGTSDSGAAMTPTNISSADVARVQEISQRIYGFTAGVPGQARQDKDFKLLFKFDWDINFDHHVEAKFQRTSGDSIIASSIRDDELPLTSHWYKRTDSINTSTLRLLSDWDDALSTKLEISHKKVETLQNPLEGNGFMEAAIDNGNGGSILIGPEVFRHANRLKNEVISTGVEGHYLLGTHVMTFGLTHEKNSIFNLFAPYSNGSAEYDSFEAFEAQNPSSLFYQNAISNNSNDASASFDIGTTSAYLQDEFNLQQNLMVRLGVRLERYKSTDAIRYNENFEQRHGFANTADLNGKQLSLPRMALSYQPSNRLSLSGGLGLYGGGTPNVWVANSYLNDGVNIDNAFTNDAAGFDGRHIPDSLKSQLQAGDGNVDALDPDFKLPHSLKIGTDLHYQFDVPGFLDNINVEVGYTYTKVKQALLWRDLRRNHTSFVNNQAQAVAPDGRAIYDTELATDTDTDFDTRRGYDMLLTNTDKGFGHNLSIGLGKAFSNGFSISTSYNWQRVQDINPGNSSRSVSNYGRVAIGHDPNNPDLARSNYERKHRYLIETSYNHSFFERLVTSFSLFMERRSGQPFSYTFGGDRADLAALYGEDQEFAKRERMLFYVPKGDGSDVEYAGEFNIAAFNRFLDKSGLAKYRGKIAPRNEFFSDWIDNINMRIVQDLPGYKEGQSATIVLDIENVPNLLNHKWGQQKSARFPFLVPVVDVDYNESTGKYAYSNFREYDQQEVNDRVSIGKMALSVYYNF